MSDIENESMFRTVDECHEKREKNGEKYGGKKMWKGDSKREKKISLSRKRKERTISISAPCAKISRNSNN